ncbi:MAG: PIN/TRAM domain-containing protein [Bacteroidota bacterium]
MFGKISKLICAAATGIAGILAARWLGLDTNSWWLATGAGLGVLLGATVMTRLIALAYNGAVTRLSKLSLAGVFAGGVGLLFGLLVSALGVVLLRLIYGPVNPAWETLAVVLVVTGTARFAHFKRLEFMGVLRPTEVMPERALSSSPSRMSCKVLDTSAIIDGRIADICKTGFLEGTLLVPGFVLAELQRIADSSDTLKRNRGRRGLDILNRMQKEGIVTVKIYDRDFDDLSEVDTKIVRLARILDARVVTNDFNLNKVAELYGVPVLNINELSNAIKPIVLPGEEMFVHIIKDGKEFGQGIGYLEDGTMVVVDGGRQHIGENLEVLVTSVLQTAAGRMIFGKPKDQPRQALAQNQ